jgi:two-component system, OmpR family, sensor histidine kinase VicK
MVDSPPFAKGEGMSSSDVLNTAIRVVSTPDRIRQQYLNLIKNASREILIVFPTINSIHRETSIGVMQELRNAIKRGVRVRILSAEDDFIKGSLDDLRACGIVIRRIETPTENKFKMLIVDRSASLVVETKDDSKSLFQEAVGLATFSTSKATVLPYVTIFESFWREIDLYEKARESDRVKDEFVNIAAHELRTPITPIIAGAELIRDIIVSAKGQLDEGMYADLLHNANIIVRNASKLHRLSEDILQVNRIESGTFRLNLKMVDLDLLITTIIGEIESRYAGQMRRRKIVYESKIFPGDLTLRGDDEEVRGGFRVYCDDDKISRVLYNILDNAMKFTQEGEIAVRCSIDPSEKEVVISIKDSGSGIDPAIKPMLFEKFSAKSQSGTGIGLYLSKKIVEAHNGRIWGGDNADGKGATFDFTLPLDIYPG